MSDSGEALVETWNGQLTTDPELGYGEGRRPFVRFRMNVRVPIGDGDSVAEIRRASAVNASVIVTGRAAENVSKSLVEGDDVVVIGRTRDGLAVIDQETGATVPGERYIAATVAAADLARVQIKVVRPVRATVWNESEVAEYTGPVAVPRLSERGERPVRGNETGPRTRRGARGIHD